LERVLQVDQGGEIEKLLPPELIPDPPSTSDESRVVSEAKTSTSWQKATSSSYFTDTDGCGQCKKCREAAELEAICFEVGSSLPQKRISATKYGSNVRSGSDISGSGAPGTMRIVKHASLVWKKHFAT
jgi:hypothetical protein